MSTAEKNISWRQYNNPPIPGFVKKYLISRQKEQQRAKEWNDEVKLRLFGLRELEPFFLEMKKNLNSNAVVGTVVNHDRESETTTSITRICWDFHEIESTFKQMTMVRNNLTPHSLFIYSGEHNPSFEIDLNETDWKNKVQGLVDELRLNPDLCLMRVNH